MKNEKLRGESNGRIIFRVRYNIVNSLCLNGMNIKTTLRISLNINMGYLLFFGISIIVIWGILEYFGVGD